MTCGKSCECPSYRDHLLSINISSSATPTRRAQAAEVGALEARWERDGEAYKRLRNDNLQPPHVDGSAELEAKANDRIEIETGQRFNKKNIGMAKDIQEAFK